MFYQYDTSKISGEGELAPLTPHLDPFMSINNKLSTFSYCQP